MGFGSGQQPVLARRIVTVPQVAGLQASITDTNAPPDRPRSPACPSHPNHCPELVAHRSSHWACSRCCRPFRVRQTFSQGSYGRFGRADDLFDRDTITVYLGANSVVFQAHTPVLVRKAPRTPADRATLALGHEPNAPATQGARAKRRHVMAPDGQ
jgi:hypothetical protein